MSNKTVRKRPPVATDAKPQRSGTACCCGHSGGARTTQHTGGKHGIPYGYGRCIAKGCHCRRFLPMTRTSNDQMA